MKFAMVFFKNWATLVGGIGGAIFVVWSMIGLTKYTVVHFGERGAVILIIALFTVVISLIITLGEECS